MAPTETVIQRLEELRRERGISRKKLAARLGRTRQAVDKAMRASTLSVTAAEAIAEVLGVSVEVVERDNPVADFRRALAANRDLSEPWRRTIWQAFLQAKEHAMSEREPEPLPLARRRVSGRSRAAVQGTTGTSSSRSLRPRRSG